MSDVAMRALHAYAKSDPSRLAYEDAPRPTLVSGDVLVRVHASGVSPGELDWPSAWLDHDDAPRRPPIIPGHEVAGVVVEVGSGVTGLAAGDEVYGYIDVRRDGADAEYVAVRVDDLAPKPATLTHALAAAVPLSALTAWQALFEQGELQPGQRVLIHGGAGGVGSFAVQLARWRGAHVAATSSADDADLVRELGADEVIDYRAHRFEDAVTDLDLVFDTVGGDTWERSWDVVRPGGRLVSIAVPRPPPREPVDGPRAIWFIVRPDRQQLREIGGLIDAGSVRPIVSAVLPLAKGPEAYGPGRQKGGPGKAVLLVTGGLETRAGPGDRVAPVPVAPVHPSEHDARSDRHAAGDPQMTIFSPDRSTLERSTATSQGAIRPFEVNVPQGEIDELRRRIAATRWPEKETVDDQSQGVPLAITQELARYWATDYDWRTCESRLNALPQFVTEIDGLDIHFIHVRSTHDDALPLIVTHGWPGSIIEQLKIIDPLTNPTAHRGSGSDAFHLVVPSMPGYGFSGKPTSTGWGPERMARAWAELMRRLGYTRYVAQGGDWGAFVVDQMGLQAPDGLLAIHTNMPATVPADINAALVRGDPTPAGLSVDEERACAQLTRTFRQVEYARMMAARPQTLYGIADSPVGLAAWLLDHNDAGGQPAAAVASALDRTASATGELTRDEVLDNITLYWLTNTGVSASRLYWEYRGGFFDAKGVSIPVAVSVFPGEQYQAPRSWTESAYPNLIYFNELDKGGHFAAWEVPGLFADEIRAAFRALR